jgi:hypothetical protein
MSSRQLKIMGLVCPERCGLGGKPLPHIRIRSTDLDGATRCRRVGHYGDNPSATLAIRLREELAVPHEAACRWGNVLSARRKPASPTGLRLSSLPQAPFEEQLLQTASCHSDPRYQRNA